MTNIVNKILNVEVANLPVGKAFLLTAAFGLANGLSSTLDRLVGSFLPGTGLPPIVVQAGVAAALENIGPVKNFLGADLTDLISIAALTSGINNQFNVSGTIVGLLNKVTNLLPGGNVQQAIQAPVPVVPAASDQGSLSGYNLGQARTQLPNVDDVDLALLSARGYQTA